MTLVTISSDDPRSIKAISIAAGAGQWLRCRLADGAKAYGVPSQCLPGRYYLVDLERCTCEDFKRNGLSSAQIGRTGLHGPCKHVLAVRLHLALLKGAQQLPRCRSAFVASHINSSGETVYLPRRPGATLTPSTDTCALNDDHADACSPINPIAGSLPELRCGLRALNGAT